MHLIILYCSYIWSNAHYYSLALVEQIIFAWMEQQLNTWEEMMPIYVCVCVYMLTTEEKKNASLIIWKFSNILSKQPANAAIMNSVSFFFSSSI